MRKTMFWLVFALLVGVLSFVGGWRLAKSKNIPEPTTQCLRGNFSVQTSFDPGFSGGIIGEQVLCGENLKISGIYGPNLDVWIREGIDFHTFRGGFNPPVQKNDEESNPIP